MAAKKSPTRSPKKLAITDENHPAHYYAILAEDLRGQFKALIEYVDGKFAILDRKIDDVRDALSREIQDVRLENRLRWDENDKRWAENDKRWDENDKFWKENALWQRECMTLLKHVDANTDRHDVEIKTLQRRTYTA